MALKTCTRGHRYDGPGGCPVCWSGNRHGAKAAGKSGQARPSRGARARPAAAATRKRAAARSPRRSR